MYADLDRRRATRRAYYLAHREEILAKYKAWDPKRREAKRAYSRAWRAAHIEAVRESDRRRYAANREKEIARAAARRLQNPERWRAYRRVYQRAWRKTPAGQQARYKHYMMRPFLMTEDQREARNADAVRRRAAGYRTPRELLQEQGALVE